MSWVATAGGFILGPVVGALGSRLVTDRVKPKELSTYLLIGAGVHAAAAALAYSVSESSHEENVQAFAYGTTWGSGIAAGLLGVGGVYATTDAGNLALGSFNRPLGRAPVTSGYLSPSKKISGGRPHGLLGLLTAAKAQGY
jgi:high-affinity Fe2+/Pb2+ permease